MENDGSQAPTDDGGRPMMEALLKAESAGEEERSIGAISTSSADNDKWVDLDYRCNDSNNIHDDTETGTPTSVESTEDNSLEEKMNQMKESVLVHNDVHTPSKFAKFDAVAASSPSINGNATTRRRSREENIVATANDKISRVEKSWYIVSDRIGEVGLKFFLRMFDEYPELVQLFPFGDDSINPVTGKLELNDRTKAHVRAHATAVLRVVGTCVAGVTSIEDLIPRLRQVGATHKTVGVQPMHYDILYRHLVRAIREEVGPDNWDQETEDAWEQAYRSIADLIKRPSKRLETEPLRGWGIIMLISCAYFMVVTPFRFAGFLYGRPTVLILLNMLDGLAALVMALDLMMDFIQTKLRVRQIVNVDSSSASTSWSKSIRRVIFQKRLSIVKKLGSYRMDRWVPWPALDLKVLLSFPLQWMFVSSSICAKVGLHWTQLFGLLRVLTAARVLHFMQCAENNALLGQQLNADRQLQLRVAKLLFRLAFIIHLSACIWFIVARVEIGANATELTPTSFFPSPDVLFDPNGNAFNSYSRAIHWAFVNLSGIGGIDSVPVSTLECWSTLIVHMIGAVFYAIVTGNVIAILEEQSKRDNKIGGDIVRLSTYMNTARVSEFSKSRIMKGFMMKNVLTQSSQGGPQGSTGGDLDLNDDVLNTLPNYLRVEVSIYARAESIRRRDKFFLHCSNGFLVALSSSLSRTRTLLTGDYLMHEIEQYIPEFVFVESGSLQVRRGQHTIKTVNRGDCIGKAWLLQLKNESKNPEEYSEITDWLLNDGTAAVSIRALSPCILFTGLSTAQEINKLEHGYKVDFQLLRAEARGACKNESERMANAMKGIAKAVRLFKARRKQSRSLSHQEDSQSSLDFESLKRVVDEEG